MPLEREPGSIRKLLIVEDEPLVAFDNEYFLGSNGFTVVATVDNADEASALIARGGIDLVLCDVRLNCSDGRDVALAAKAAAIPLLFVTATCPIDAQDIAVGCLTKPYSQKELKSAITAVADILKGRNPMRLPKGLALYG
jgi:DNA-binding response OmpR family regulator